MKIQLIRVLIFFALSHKISSQNLQLHINQDHGYNYVNINSKAFYVYDTVNIFKIVNPDNDFESVIKVLGNPVNMQDNSNIARNEYVFYYPGLELFFNNDDGSMRLVAFDITGQDCTLNIHTFEEKLIYPFEVDSNKSIQHISENNARISLDEEKIISLRNDIQSGGKFFGEVFIKEGVVKKVRIYM